MKICMSPGIRRQSTDEKEIKQSHAVLFYFFLHPSAKANPSLQILIIGSILGGFVPLCEEKN
ncbi:MAG: hypothetical protein A2X48_03325 [Lentisphaerae bacterium GWF2_49_21]|nr:MAG: hypothetical protein A2X48_03325 [Lentisphaerae bacterium GWF2_49_21]